MPKPNRYLYRFKNSNNYYFRMRINLYIKMCNINLGHLCASLRTSDELRAQLLALYIKRGLDKEVKVMKKGCAVDMSTVDFSELVPTIGQVDLAEFEQSSYSVRLKSHLKMRFNKLLESGTRLIDSCLYDEIDLPEPLNSIERRELELSANQMINSGSEHIEEFLSEIPPELRESPSGDKASALIETCFMIDQLLSELRRAREKSGHSFLLHEASMATPADIINLQSEARLFSKVKSFVEPIASEKQSHLDKECKVSTLYERFKLEKGNSVDGKTIDHYDIAFNFLTEKFGDLDVRQLDKKLAVAIKQAVMERRGRRTNKEETLSASRINAFLSNYRTFMTWYLAHSDEERVNPFSGLDVEENKKTERFPRRVFSENELHSLANYKNKHKSEAKNIRNAAFWFPKIGMYSGARLNEIANLTPERIRQQNGVWVFDLVGLDLKNEASERLIPIHQSLLDDGIVEFSRKQKEAKCEKLFSELKEGKNGFGDSVSKWFNRTMLRNIGIDKEAEQSKGVSIDFHCLRKTFIDELVKRGFQLHQIKMVVGHSNEDDITLRHYTASPVSLNVLRDVVNQIPSF